MPFPPNPAEEARAWHQRQELEELQRRNDEYFNRLQNPFIRINERLDQLEQENLHLRQRLSALELKAQRGPDDW